MLTSYLVKLALPVLGCAVGLRAAQRRGLSLESEIGLRAPRLVSAAWWGLLWLAWLAVSEWVIVRLELAQAETWPAIAGAALAARVAALVISGPAAEEFVARGLGLALLRRRGWPPMVALTATAAIWAAAHYRYGWGTVLLMTIDGLLLGGARLTSGSLWVPFGMHAIANALSVMQSLGW